MFFLGDILGSTGCGSSRSWIPILSVAIALVIVTVVLILNMFLAAELSHQYSSASPTLRVSSVKHLHIVVLVDNHADPKQRCLSAWGLSLYIETDNTRILFDTGPDPELLLYNAKAMGIDLAKLSAVVISHEHGDHVGGLKAIAELNKSVPIYIPSGMSLFSKRWIKSLGFEHVIEVSNTTFIAPGIAIVGQLYGPPYEQALAIELAGRGLVIVVGCSHPGIVQIAEKAARDLGGKPYAVIGGLHLVGAPRSEVLDIMEDLKNLGVQIAIPLHCSGDIAMSIASKLFGFNESTEGHVCSQIAFDG